MDEEVFIYDAQQNRLVCASCNPDSSKRPTGVFDQERAGEGMLLTVDPTGMWGGHWLAGLIPGWSPIVPTIRATHQPAYLSDGGRLFFDSADALVYQDQNTRTETIGTANEKVGVEDVYEFEPEGVGTCTAAPGCATLISSGTDSRESAFLDASSNGSDVFLPDRREVAGARRRLGERHLRRANLRNLRKRSMPAAVLAAAPRMQRRRMQSARIDAAQLLLPVLRRRSPGPGIPPEKAS